MNYWLIIRLPILFAIGVSGRVGGWSGSWRTWTVTRRLMAGRMRAPNTPPLPLCSCVLQVNFLIFIRVICIVVSKLKANLMCKTDIKCRYVNQGGYGGGGGAPSAFQQRENLGCLFGTLCNALFPSRHGL